MIPSNSSIVLTNLEIETQPSKGHKMHIQEDVVRGTCDDIEAMRQVIYKILNTERYQHIIYSWNYGMETLDLFGRPVGFVCPELKRRIEEALLQDDRITSVDGFEFDISKKKIVSVTFTVHTIFGDVDSEKVVNI